MEGVLSTRARVVPEYYAMIPEEGIRKSELPWLERCKGAVMVSPKLGAGFTAWHIKAEQEGRTAKDLGGGKDTELFLYVKKGCFTVKAGDMEKELKKGSYVYAPPGVKISFQSSSLGEIFLYKKKYIPLENKNPWLVWGNAEKLPWNPCDGMENLLSKDLLPSDKAFDIGFHILLFKKGGSHSFVETHHQEHGAFVLQGEGMYLLDSMWGPVKEGDFIWMGPFVPQAAYGIGTGEFSYLFSKDCNRDVILQ